MATLNPAFFGDIQVGTFFKDGPAGSWHLKTSTERAIYYHDGVRGDPQFLPGETVYIDSGDAKAGKIFSEATAESFIAFAPRRSVPAGTCEAVGCSEQSRSIYPLCRRMCGPHIIKFLDPCFRGCGCGPEPCPSCARHIAAGRRVIVVGERENGPRNAVDDEKMIACLDKIPPQLSPLRALLDFQRFRRAFSWGSSRARLLSLGLRWDLSMNLLCSSPKSGDWSVPVARRVAAGLAPVLVATGASLVLLGVRVRDAFAGQLPEDRVTNLPHPSGANRTWNDRRSVEDATSAVSRIYAP